MFSSTPPVASSEFVRLPLPPLELGTVSIEIVLPGLEALGLLLEVGRAAGWAHISGGGVSSRVVSATSPSLMRKHLRSRESSPATSESYFGLSPEILSKKFCGDGTLIGPRRA